MARRDEPSYTDLVYEILRSTAQPLAFWEILDEVNRRRPLTTRNPTATIRGVLSAGRQLIGVGDGRFGYLPHLEVGSLLRLPLTEYQPAYHPLVYPEEIREALWPSFFETQKRSDRRPVQIRLANGKMISLPLESVGASVYGSPMTPTLRHFLVKSHAAAGDSLLVRIVNGEPIRGEVQFEPRGKRDEAAVAKRNRELADTAYEILSRNPPRDMASWDLAAMLLGRGAYRSDVAPDALPEVLGKDQRFLETGFGRWMLAEAVMPEMMDVIRRRKKLEGELVGLGSESRVGEERAVSTLDMRRAMGRMFADIGAMVSEREFESNDDVNAFLRELMAKGGVPRRQPRTPLEEAQALMYDAWSTASSRERVRLAKKALEISPDCADAYVMLAEETARDAAEAADLYAKGVAAGERALGREAFENDAGSFWSIVQTRPYMRARLGLALALWSMGRQQEGIGHARELLRLNPGDN